MLRAELLETGNTLAPSSSLIFYSTGENHPKKDNINLMNNDGQFL